MDIKMDDLQVMYSGREVSKHGFRVFIYAKDGKKKLVNSWDEFMTYVKSGEWFSSIEEIMAHEQLDKKAIEPESNKRGRKKAS